MTATFESSTSASPSSHVTLGVTVADLVEAVRRQQTPHQGPQQALRRAADAAPENPAARRIASVAAAHPGAGATSVAVALSDAVAGIGHRVALLDAAARPDAFGAVANELSATNGSRRGRRGTVEVLRAASTNAFDHRVNEGADDGVVVVDGADRELAKVLVCRASIPGVGAVERLLRPEAFVAVVGVSRWPRLVAASVGPRLAEASREGRVVFFPFDRGLALRGVDATRMPTCAVDAGARLAGLLWPELDVPVEPVGWGRRAR